MLYLKSELTHGHWRIYSDNIAMARWLQQTVQGMLNAELKDTSIPVIDAEFTRSGDPRYFWTEHVSAADSEVALTWYKYPETIQRKEMEPRIAPNGSFADAEDYRRTFPDGRIGSDPNQATPEHGKRFYDTAVEEVARDYEAWVAR